MRRLIITTTVVLSLLLLVAVSASAETLSPWWHLSSSTRPTHLQSGHEARDEVQEIEVRGTFTLEMDDLEVRSIQIEVGTFALEPGLTAAVVQAALEGEEFYGKGNVEVSEQAGSTPGTLSLRVKSVGKDADQMVPLLEAYPATVAKATIATTGRPDGYIVVTAANLGDATASGCSKVNAGGGEYLDSGCTEEATEPGTGEYELTPITIADKLPAGLTPVSIVGNVGESVSTFGSSPSVSYPLKCVLGSLSCTFTGRSSRKHYPSGVPPYNQLQVRIGVNLTGADPNDVNGEVSEAKISGGEAPSATARQSLAVSGQPLPFGVGSYELRPEEVDGVPDTQAGSHPFQFTTGLMLNESIEGEPVAMAKDLHFKLPPGLIGNPTPFPQCKLAQFLNIRYLNGVLQNECSPQTVVGVARSVVRLDYQEDESIIPFTEPIYNLEPAFGEPARFGFIVHHEASVLLNTAVRTGGDYGVTVSISNISQQVEFLSSEVTLWGVPGDPRHDRSRGVACLEGAEELALRGDEEQSICPSFEAASHPPSLLELPTSCTGPLQTSVEADSWLEPHTVVSRSNTEPMPALDGCDRLPFSPSLSITPDGQEGSTPTGLSVAVHVPQDASLTAGGIGEANVKDTVVALPEGVQISPAAADGLLACSTSQIGFTGVEPGTGTNLFTPGVGSCPDASKIGTVEIKTPLLPEPVEGGVYLAAQEANPFGSLIAMYIDAENAKEGVAIKLAGEVKLDPVTGQIVTTFTNTPQVLFEEAKLHFFGGVRAPLSTPPLCGSYTSSGSITPWSGNAPARLSSTFDVTTGPNGSPCASPRPFQPGFNAGTTSVQAGGYTPLTMTLSRPDADQQLGKLSVVFPPGVSSALRGVKLCEEPQAATGQCPAESQIGTVTVSAGLGGDPYPVETGKAYITGPYEGDPFGVDVVVPAVAGPFNLGTEVVRSKVDVDPTDAHLTVVSDAFPTMLDGIPLQLQHINVLVNRPGFVFNPTSCEPMKLTGVLGSSEGATADVSTPFQVTNCAALSFKPEFAVSTSAKTSRVEGASLHVSLTLPAGAQGTKANVSKVKVSLPKQLPSPLKTLQKACTEKVFAENPSSCPKASRVGEAKVETPVLEGPLTGPAYFVSHGGAKYPELIIVLTGEDGVTVQVHGETFISKAGITTATFGTVPDVPFSNFELELPEREYPALTANGNLCKGTLIMPTEFLGQNGLKINQETKISVTGCPKSKKAAKKKAKKHKAHGKKKR